MIQPLFDQQLPGSVFALVCAHRVKVLGTAQLLTLGTVPYAVYPREQIVRGNGDNYLLTRVICEHGSFITWLAKETSHKLFVNWG